jgi:hypothetical protein
MEQFCHTLRNFCVYKIGPVNQVNYYRLIIVSDFSYNIELRR